MFEMSLTSCFFTQDTELQLLKKGKYPGNHLETGETQLQTFNKREFQLDMLVEDKRMCQQKLKQREKQTEHLQSNSLSMIRLLEI